MIETSTQTPILGVSDLRKSYGKVKAVDGIDLSVREGSCFGILGPNGAGKTTAIEVMETIQAVNAEGMTVVVVTHEHVVSEQVKRVVRLVDGRIADDRRLDGRP